MFKFLEQTRKPTLDLPVAERRALWFWPFMRSYLVVFVCYMAMYLIRKNYNVAQPDLISTYGLTKTELGMIGLGFSITYGLGKTVMSYFADGKNTKQFLPLMLTLSAICMLGFSASLGGGSAALFLMISFYAMSGLFQAPGGPSSAATITKWTPTSKRGFFLGLWNMSHNVGGMAAAGVALFGANFFFDGHVVGMFVFPSIVALIIAAFCFFMGNDSPEAYGLGKAEELFNEPPSQEDEDAEKENLSKFQIFLKYALFNKVILILCVASIFLYIVRIGIDQWSPVYAVEQLGFTKEVSMMGFTVFETGALIGTILWGFFSDIVKGRRCLLAVFALGIIIATLSYYQHASSPMALYVALFILGFSVFGVQLLIGVSAVGFVPKKGLAVADGFRGTFAYLIGDSFAKIGLGMIADGKPVFGYTGWTGTFLAIDMAAMLCIALLVIVAVLEEIKIRKSYKKFKENAKF